MNPGKLSVSRTIGDVESKLAKYGGMLNVISAVPEIKSFKLDDSLDFILLGCDGIFDRITSEEAIRIVWQSAKDHTQIHQFIGDSIASLMQEALMRKSFDNVTVVIIGLKNLEQYFIDKLNLSFA